MYSIEIENLTKKFKEKTAVNNVSLKIKQGELFSLLGTNGAGKTTTIKMLSTLILPTSGNIKINGLDINKDKQKIKQIRRSTKSKSKDFIWRMAKKSIYCNGSNK